MGIENCVRLRGGGWERRRGGRREALVTSSEEGQTEREQAGKEGGDPFAWGWGGDEDRNWEWEGLVS